MKSNSIRKSGFTLIELLVVIGIIGILMAILLPAINGVRYQSLRLDELNKAKQLENAVNRYYMAYQKLPKADDGLDSYDQLVDSTLLDTLEGNNPRSIMFFTIKGSMKNTWKGDFYISMDGDGDNQIIVDGETRSGNVAVYTKSPKETIGSWQK